MFLKSKLTFIIDATHIAKSGKPVSLFVKPGVNEFSKEEMDSLRKDKIASFHLKEGNIVESILEPEVKEDSKEDK